MTPFKSIRLDGFLSFQPGTPALDLQSLNILIGPNGSGKSNVIEAFRLLQAAPRDIQQQIVRGGGTDEWIWKGDHPSVRTARIRTIVAETEHSFLVEKLLDYEIELHTPPWDPIVETIRDTHVTSQKVVAGAEGARLGVRQ